MRTIRTYAIYQSIADGLQKCVEYRQQIGDRLLILPAKGKPRQVTPAEFLHLNCDQVAYIGEEYRQAQIQIVPSATQV